MNNYPIVYAIVVTWNGAKWIRRCIDSLVKSVIPIHIVVVDNDSADNTKEIILESYSEITLIRLNENVGFGKANNIGIKLAMENNADFIFLMNQDAWIEPNAIKELVRVSMSNPEYGILSPFHLSGDENNIDYSFNYYLAMHVDIRLISDLYISPRLLREVYNTTFVNAAFWLLTSNCVSTVGGFDPLFYVYGEDLDYSNRAIYHGFRIGICPRAKGFHDRPQHYNPHNKDKIYSEVLLNAKTNLPRPIRILFTTIKNVMLFAVHNHQSYKYKIMANIDMIRRYRKIKSHHLQSKQRGLNFLDLTTSRRIPTCEMDFSLHTGKA